MPINKLIAPRRGEAIVDSEGRASRRMTEYMELNASIVKQDSTEVVELGDWNMDTTPTISVAHGLEYADIIAAEAFVRNDADTAKFNIGVGVDQFITNPRGFVGQIDATNIAVTRKNGSGFDTPSYSATSYNRGWLIITYINQ